MRWSMVALVLAVLVTLAQLLQGRENVARFLAGLRSWRAPLLLATGLLMLLLLAARRYEEVRSYALMALSGAILYASLLCWVSSSPARAVATVRRAIEVSPAWIAVGFAIIAAIAGRFVLGNMPHVSDEVAYQFQARSLALGGLSMPAPPVPEAFNFLHLLIDHGKWYGIMNPGWPAFLAVGEILRVPWVVNPILGALVIVVFAGFFREAGLDRTESRIAIWLMAISPLLVFMSGTYMSHPVNLLLFGVFCWAWARMLNRESIAAAAVAGLALAVNLLVRPVDSAVVALPFLIQLLMHLRRRPRLLLPLATVAIIGGAGIAGTLAYDKALTGNAMEMPVTKYFNLRNPHEHFGLGFGPEMGTKLHGDEWPGFTPVDAVRVTAYRTVEFLKDMYGLPLVLLAGILAGLRGSWRAWGEWRLVLLASGLAVIAIYFLHFYHGIAYGSRHYYLAVPAVALVLGRLAARGLGEEDPATRGMAASALAVTVVTMLTFAVPPLVREYSSGYRGVSTAVADAVRRARIRRAIVFVEAGSWSWKSAFPLNQYPLDAAEVIFARDRGNENTDVIARFPSRTIFYLAVGPANQVVIRPATRPASAP